MKAKANSPIKIHSIWADPKKPVTGEVDQDSIKWKAGRLMCVDGIFDMGAFRAHTTGYTYCVDNVAFSCRVGQPSPDELSHLISGSDPINEHTLQSYKRAAALAKNLEASAAPSP